MGIIFQHQTKANNAPYLEKQLRAFSAEILQSLNLFLPETRASEIVVHLLARVKRAAS